MKRLLVCLLPLLLLSGCAYKRVIFNNLDWLVVYQMDSYLDLTSTQEKQIKIPVHETVTWLKAERLEEVHSFLREIETAAAAKRIDAKLYDRWVGLLNGLRTEVTDRMTPPLVVLLKQLDDGQIDHLQKKLEKEDKNLSKLVERSEKEFPGEFDDFVDDAASKYKFWFGKLRKDQKEILVLKLGWNRTSLTEQLKMRKHSRDLWIELLKKRDAEALTAAMKASASPQGSWNETTYKAYRQELRDRFRDFLLALFVSLDQDQWQHFEKVARDLAMDVQSLAEQERTKS